MFICVAIMEAETKTSYYSWLTGLWNNSMQFLYLNMI